MSEADTLRRQVREEILRTAGPVLTIRCEADLQALNKLIRELGSNPLVAAQLGAGVGGMQIQVMPGDYDGCGCHTEPSKSVASRENPAYRASMAPALGGLITLSRIQAANLPKGSEILLDQDAVITPQVRDWLRQNKIQIQRSES